MISGIARRLLRHSVIASALALPFTVAFAAEAPKPVNAFVTIQDAEGTTEENLGPEALKNIEAWVVETVTRKSRDAFAAQGFDPAKYRSNIRSQSMYVKAGGKTLILVKVNNGDAIQMVMVMAIIGSELHRVNCYREGTLEIPVWSGVCGDKIREALGVSLQP